MTPDRRTCEETIAGRTCGLPARWLVGLDADGLYPACSEHASAWADDCRAPLGPTPIQWAIVTVIETYAAVCGLLNPAERDTLRDVLCARIAKDYLAERGDLVDLDHEAEAA